jgi:hypothetical protein
MIKTVSLVFIFTIIYATTVFTQSGFKTIQKADIKYEKGKYYKSLNLLNKADTMNYGFCGNAWMDANSAINILRYHIYTDLENYQMARNSLDSITWIRQGSRIDSLKIRSYQLQYGAKTISELIDTTLNNVTIICQNNSCYAQIPIFYDSTLIKLKFSPENSYYLGEPVNENQRLQQWIEDFKKSRNYIQLISPVNI